MKPTQEQAKFFLPWVQALAEGKTVEYREADGIWHPLNVWGEADWFTKQDINRQFRIKPEAETKTLDCWVAVTEGGCIVCAHQRSEIMTWMNGAHAKSSVIHIHQQYKAGEGL